MKLQAIDIGVNLTDKRFLKDWDHVADESLENGIGIIITGCGEASDLKAVQQARMLANTEIKCTAGLHPHHACEYSESFRQWLQMLVMQNRDVIVAIGEAGLDYDRMYSPMEQQIHTFRHMIELARETDLPMFLHERSAVQDFYEILKQNRDIAEKSVVHCFTGTVTTAKKYLELGCMIGITGWICDDRRNTDLIEAVKYIPLDRMMVETDSPYLIPRCIRHMKRNNPYFLPYVWEEIARIKNEEPEMVCEIMLKNTKSFFNM